ncbi:MAG: signal peptidase I [Lachnospiraceae bacterium]
MKPDLEDKINDEDSDKEYEEYPYEKELREKRKKSFNGIIQFGICLFAAVLISFFIVHYVAQRTTVDGMSMYNTLNDGDNLIIEKLSYRFGDVERFDIVVFPYYDGAAGMDVYYIKRIIGLPGETIQITDGKIYINGDVLEEDYGYYIDDIPMKGYDAEEEIYIGENEYFVLGDNRNNSTDSRKIGCITRDHIEGRACFRIFPLNKFGVIK